MSDPGGLLIGRVALAAGGLPRWLPAGCRVCSLV